MRPDRPFDCRVITPQSHHPFHEIMPIKSTYQIHQHTLYFDEVTIQPLKDFNELFIGRYWHCFDSFLNIYIHFIAVRKENNIHLELLWWVWI